MNSLKSIYENSNFYKEARIISFLDHLFKELMDKIKVKLPLDLVTLKMTKLSDIEDDFDDAVSILEKYKKGININYHNSSRNKTHSYRLLSRLNA